MAAPPGAAPNPEYTTWEFKRRAKHVSTALIVKLFISVQGVVTLLLCATLTFDAILPMTWPFLTVVLLAPIAATMRNFIVHERVSKNLAVSTSLDEAIGVSAALLLDWHAYVAFVVLEHLCMYVDDTARKVRKSELNVRLVNTASVVLAGAATQAWLHVTLSHGADLAFAASWWFDPRLPLVLLGAAAMWTFTNGAVTRLVAELVRRKWDFQLFRRWLFVRDVLFSAAGVPFALLWHMNLWMAFFAIAPLALAFGVLRVPELQARLRTDSQTGLTNAGAFDEELAQTIERAERANQSIALVLVDLDHFKHVNDTYGHAAGTAAIVRVASILRDTARSVDVIARVGGEEFAVLMNDSNRVAGVGFAEQLRGAIEADRFDTGTSSTFQLTASCGVAVYPDEAADARSLFYAADMAMYAAKRGGRNRVVSGVQTTSS
jgi:diguanylate cyclase (GGDEF)-like protein